jgi:uncharacterized membrane protein
MGREVGVVLIVLGLILVAYSLSVSNEGEFGAVILIGPIPIVLGSSPEIAAEMMIIGALFMMLTILFFFGWRRLT